MPPHTRWGKTATEEYKVSQYLSTFQLESEKVVEQMRKKIKDAYPDLVNTQAHDTTILWCSVPYGYLICNPDCGVQLKVMSFKGDHGHVDTRAEHSHLLEIHPHTSQVGQKSMTEKLCILIGLLQFVNHASYSYNAEVIDLRLAFVVQITRAIKLGDEVFLDYGDKYFEDQGGSKQTPFKEGPKRKKSRASV
ncbi:hypothetical protein K443DRAFT_134929 [Laccaria amethystina LaAM-08-1]|uniref:SET domain-containing protein n=1 Tax=Laccaria amethystina LaAM-08-1 TaxID=1095629 RepID=A0A0C9WJ12_9AGAR|nr:hypothetical protein K443DRAFT_134929 [Laccaria amethystina LaAM-08-1]